MRVRFELAAGSIAALDNGSAGASGTVLLVPGYTGSKEDFQPLLRPLAEAGLRAVAIDQRGQYQSEWARTEHGYQLAALAAEVLELTKLLGDGPLHLVGHSFGGLVARQAALLEPTRFTDLVLMSSGPAAIGGPRRALLDSGEVVLATAGMHGLWDHIEFQSQANPRYVRPAPALQAFLRERFLATDPVGLRVMGETLRVEVDRTAELAALRLAILVLYGEADDAWSPALQSEMASRLAARRSVVSSAAHSPAVENPAGTAAALLDFWLGG